jgi:chaperonin GroEL (HSP60 family)
MIPVVLMIRFISVGIPVSLMKLRQLHSEGKVFAAIDAVNGEILEDAIEKNIIEPVIVKKNVIKSATEAATTILKIDDIIAASPLKKEEKEKKGGKSKFGGEF